MRILIAVVMASMTLAAQGDRTLGTVTAVSAAPRGFTVRTDAAEEKLVAVTEETKLRRVAPGEKDLAKAEGIAFDQVKPGDRVMVRGEAGDSGVIFSRVVVVMSRGEIETKQQKEREEWQKRSVAGLVEKVNESKGEITLRVPSMMEEQMVTVETGAGTKLRRYAPDSVKFADAKECRLAELKKGDQIRALGEKSADGTRIKAEQVVSGSFQSVAGTVVAVRPEAGELDVKLIESGKPLLVRVTKDASVKRMTMPGGAGPMAGGPPMGPGNGVRPGGGAPDFGRMIERMPAGKLVDVKPGETVIVASTKGVKEGEVSAITMLCNAGFLVEMAQRMQSMRAMRGGGGPSMGGMGGAGFGDMSMVPMP
jgi:hypothetical protein